MSKNFDDLFNEFFDEMPNEGVDNELLKRIITALKNPEENQELTEDINDMILTYTAKEPDITEDFYENDLHYIKRIWHTPYGDIFRIVISDSEISEEELVKIAEKSLEGKSLEEKLKEAIDSENYELAAKIRDEINQSGKN